MLQFEYGGSGFMFRFIFDIFNYTGFIVKYLFLKGNMSSSPFLKILGFKYRCEDDMVKRNKKYFVEATRTYDR